ncbi:MAG: DUF362 domain-containing protein [Chloroflexota bacterium]
MSKSVVSIVKGTNAEKMVEEALNLLGGVTNLIRPGSSVVIKPNAIGGYPPERAGDTSPAVISAVIKELRKAQPKEIIMAESGGGTKDTMDSMTTNGQKKAAEDAGIDRIVDIKKEKDLIRIPIRDHRSAMEFLDLPRFLVEADHVVNLPIFKTHVSMVFTCALKNMKGIVQGLVHFQMHQTDLVQGMLDLWSIFKSDLAIVDMIRPGEGYGPLAAMPTDFGCIVAGKDPVAVDATCCRMTGVDMWKVPFFEPAHQRGIGTYDEKEIEIRGKQIKDVYKQLWVPYLEGFGEYPEYNVISKGACALCESLTAYSLERMIPTGDYDKNKGITIIMGKDAKPPKGVKPRDLIIMGDCVPKQYRDQGIFVWGCPPLEMFPTWPIIDREVEKGPPWKRNYREETPPFLEYLKKKRERSKKKS